MVSLAIAVADGEPERAVVRVPVGGNTGGTLWYEVSDAVPARCARAPRREHSGFVCSVQNPGSCIGSLANLDYKSCVRRIGSAR